MNKEALFINTPIKYIPHGRFKYIYDMLKDTPSWEICGEKFNGKPITEDEIRFVAVKSGVACS